MAPLIRVMALLIRVMALGPPRATFVRFGYRLGIVFSCCRARRSDSENALGAPRATFVRLGYRLSVVFSCAAYADRILEISVQSFRINAQMLMALVMRVMAYL